MAKSGEVQNRFAQGFAGNRAAMNANAAHHVIAVHHGHALAEFGGGDGAFLSRGSAADDHQVILNGLHQSSSRRFTKQIGLQRKAPLSAIGIRWPEIGPAAVYGSAPRETMSRRAEGTPSAAAGVRLERCKCFVCMQLARLANRPADGLHSQIESAWRARAPKV